MAEIIHDHRRALRVRLRTHSHLITSDGGCQAHLLNLSEAGALVAVLEPHQMVAGEAVELEIELDTGAHARMDGHIAHVREHMLGLDCTPSSDGDAELIQTAIMHLSRP